MKKNLSLACVLLTTMLAATSCGGGGTSSTVSSSPENSSSAESSAASADESKAEEEIPNFNGARVCFAMSGDTNWMAPSDDENGKREAAWRAEMEKKYNFKLEYLAIPGEEYVPMMVTSGVAGNPVADIYSIVLDYLPALMAKELLYPLDEIKSWDMVNGEHAMKAAADVTTWTDGHVYGIHYLWDDAPITGSKIFTVFNKTMAEGLGLDLYADCENGDWTWDKFREYSALASKDTNSDGVNDTWGFTADVNLLGLGYVGSTGAALLDDQNVINYHDPNTLLALEEYGKIKEYWNAPPAGAAGDYYMTEFSKGNTLFSAANQLWMVSRYTEMENDWGIIPFPLPKKDAEFYTVSDIDGVQVMAKNTQNPEAAAFVLKLINSEPRPWDFDENGKRIEQDKSNPYWYLNYYFNIMRDEESLKYLDMVARNEKFIFDRQRMFDIFWADPFATGIGADRPCFENFLKGVWTGTMTPEQSVQAYEAPVQELLNNYIIELQKAES